MSNVNLGLDGISTFKGPNLNSRGFEEKSVRLSRMLRLAKFLFLFSIFSCQIFLSHRLVRHALFFYVNTNNKLVNVFPKDAFIVFRGRSWNRYFGEARLVSWKFRRSHRANIVKNRSEWKLEADVFAFTVSSLFFRDFIINRACLCLSDFNAWFDMVLNIFLCLNQFFYCWFIFRYLFHYVCENGLIYLCISDDVSVRIFKLNAFNDVTVTFQEFERSRAFGFLNQIKKRFQTTYGRRAHTALPYAMNSDFSMVLAAEMVNINSSAKKWKNTYSIICLESFLFGR